ncbi:MAG TPA: hypothetical protein P5230_01575 [Candidatus Magasanikbacteria bacterium]|nr:hypothetical protein [Candidatus Magasanikbacteria bacterium]
MRNAIALAIATEPRIEQTIKLLVLKILTEKISPKDVAKVVEALVNLFKRKKIDDITQDEVQKIVEEWTVVKINRILKGG